MFWAGDMLGCLSCYHHLVLPHIKKKEEKSIKWKLKWFHFMNSFSVPFFTLLSWCDIDLLMSINWGNSLMSLLGINNSSYWSRKSFYINLDCVTNIWSLNLLMSIRPGQCMELQLVYHYVYVVKLLSSFVAPLGYYGSWGFQVDCCLGK